MNCFQFCIFAVLFATFDVIKEYIAELWIAFNFVSLQCYLQQIVRINVPRKRCELLSILYLCSVIYNTLLYLIDCIVVVNCFQFCIFAVLFTTNSCRYPPYNRLWIAFNFVSLQCYLQPNGGYLDNETSCELLSILYLCSVIYNDESPRSNRRGVVNCFQFCIFAVLFTTVSSEPYYYGWLWIAFNFVSLQCYLQHENLDAQLDAVVNCFQFCIFAVLFTTDGAEGDVMLMLWIAFNFVSLQCYLQRIAPQHLRSL